MIALRRINGQEFTLNVDLIETVEATPDTVITLTTGKKLMVKNSVDDIIEKTVNYKRLTHLSFRVLRNGPSENPGNGGN